jgi:hypothetical protein
MWLLVGLFLCHLELPNEFQQPKDELNPFLGRLLILAISNLPHRLERPDMQPRLKIHIHYAPTTHALILNINARVDKPKFWFNKLLVHVN